MRWDDREMIECMIWSRQPKNKVDVLIISAIVVHKRSSTWGWKKNIYKSLQKNWKIIFRIHNRILCHTPSYKNQGNDFLFSFWHSKLNVIAYDLSRIGPFHSEEKGYNVWLCFLTSAYFCVHVYKHWYFLMNGYERHSSSKNWSSIKNNWAVYLYSAS